MSSTGSTLSSSPSSDTQSFLLPRKDVNTENKLSVPEMANSSGIESVSPTAAITPFSYTTTTNLPDTSHADGYDSLREFRRLQKQAQKDSYYEPEFQNDSSIQSDSSTTHSLHPIHDTWEPIFVRTAKCDNCDENKKDIYQRCQECNHQLCKECMIAGKWKQHHIADLATLICAASALPTKPLKVAGRSGVGSIKKAKTASSSPKIGSGKKSVTGNSRVKKNLPLTKKVPDRLANLDHNIEEHTRIYQENMAKFGTGVQDPAEHSVESPSPDVAMTGTSTPNQVPAAKDTKPSTGESESAGTRRQPARQKRTAGASPQPIDYFDREMDDQMSNDDSPVRKKPAPGRGSQGARGVRGGRPRGASRGVPRGGPRGPLLAHNHTAFEKFSENKNDQKDIGAKKDGRDTSGFNEPSGSALPEAQHVSDIFGPVDGSHTDTASPGDWLGIEPGKYPQYSTPEHLKAPTKDIPSISKTSEHGKFSLFLQEVQRRKAAEKKRKENEAKWTALNLEFQHEWDTNPFLAKVRAKGQEKEALAQFYAAKRMIGVQRGITLPDDDLEAQM